jgi:type III secretory pathway component EscT
VGTSCNGQFLIFWFSGASPAVIDQLVHSMDSMKLTCPAG